MSNFEDLKKRMPTAVQPAQQLHAPSRQTASTAQGAHAAHDALMLPPSRHRLSLANPLLTYQEPVSDLRKKSELLEPLMPSFQEMEADMPPRTMRESLSDYLRAMKDVFSGR